MFDFVWMQCLVLFLFIVLGVVLGVTLYYELQHKQKNIKWWPNENVFDPNIKRPDFPLYLTQFSYSPLLGNACCRKMWYAFRYVRADGNYGPLSPWTTIPVQAGAKTQPCLNGPPPKGCKAQCLNASSGIGPCVLVGPESCHCNRPEIGITQELDYNIRLGEYFAVIHRQMDNFDPSDEGRQIGTLLPYYTNERGITYTFPDILYNENDGSDCDLC
jgi:hypothetical protein